MKLKDRIALVTGGGAGIGQAIARQFAAEGAQVVIAGRTEHALRKTVCAIGEARCCAIRTDVADSDSVDAQRYRQAAVETMSTALGPQRAIRVERIRDSGNGRVTTLWFGVDKKYVPLQILQTEANGETIEMRVTAIR